MGIFKEGFLVRFFLIAFLGFTVAVVASAKAAEGVDQLGKCSYADKVVSPSDGSSVILGKTGNCNSDRYLLFKLKPSGDLDTAFGNGGVAILPDGLGPYVVQLLLQSDGKLVLVTGTKISRFEAHGSLDMSYGEAGIVASLGFDATAASLDGQGRVLVAGSAVEDQMDQPVIRRFLDDGTPDGTFGTGGKVQTDLFFGDPTFGKSMRVQGVGASADGSVLVSGDIGNRKKAQYSYVPGGGPGFIRYSPTGDFDTSYGTDGFAIFADTNHTTVKATRVDDSGAATLAAQSYQYTYGCYDLQLYRFDVQGNPSSGPGGYVTCGPNVTEIVGNGAAVASSSEYGGHGWPTPPPYEFELNRIGDLGNGMSPGITDTFIGFGNSSGFGLSATADGSIVVAGATSSGCDELKPCGTGIVVARYRGVGGGLDPTFGDQGVVLLPKIVCPVRTYSDGPDGSGDRNHCLGDPNLDPPEVKGRLTAPRSRAPGMVLSVKLSNNYDLFPNPNRKLTVKLPKGLVIRPKAKRCIEAAQLSRETRTYSMFWGKHFNGPRSVTFSSGKTGFPKSSRRMAVSFGCGAFRRIPKKLYGRKLKIRVRVWGYSELYGVKNSEATIALRMPSGR